MANTVKKSAVIAFLELLRSVEAGEEVLLLRSSDTFANEAVQTYNDRLNLLYDEEMDPALAAYLAFTDKTAEKFNTAMGAAASPQVDMADKDTRQYLAAVLAQAADRVLSGAS